MGTPVTPSVTRCMYQDTLNTCGAKQTHQTFSSWKHDPYKWIFMVAIVCSILPPLISYTLLYMCNLVYVSRYTLVYIHFLPSALHLYV